MTASNPPLPPPRLDDTQFGKYRLLVEIGHGGMADVFLAVAEGPEGSGFSKLTVIKRLRKNLAEDPEFVQMLVDEARIAARLNHPNVVQTNEVGHVENQYFIAMEYLDGQPLQRIQLRAWKDTNLPNDLEYVVICDALAGLHHAHELKDYNGTALEIVHRDVTPHNIFVTYEGQVKVVDFGIARAAGRASETRDGLLKGKVRYMSPEQALGSQIDRRADIYAAGIMLWEAATGRRMWKDKDETDILSALLNGQVPISPKEAVPDVAVPDAIDAICRKALAKNVDERYATADDMRSALEQYLIDSGKLVAARRKVGPFVAELFASERKSMRVTLEAQLREMTATTTTSFRTVRAPVEGGTESGSGGRDRADGSGRGSNSRGTGRGTARTLGPGISRSRLGLGGAVAAVALAATGIFYGSQRRAEPPTQVTSGPPAQAATIVPSAAPSAAPLEIPSATASSSEAGGRTDAAPAATATPRRPRAWPQPVNPASRPTSTDGFSDFGGRK